MNLLSPGFLFALGAVALPVLIHLLNRTQVKRIRWAASRFLAAALQRNRRRLQMEDLLLLLLRCLIVAALAFAFARPVFPGGGFNFGAGDAATAVIVVDHTASMGQSAGTETRFSQAKSAGRRLLEQLPSGSSAALFLAADRTVRAVPEPTADLALVRRTLESAAPSAQGGDLFSGIKEAADLLRPLSGRRDLFVLTDSQSAAWAQHEKIQSLRAELGDAITLHIITLGDTTAPNLAITRLGLGASVPAVGQPARCEIEVKNFGSIPAENIRLTLAVDRDAPLDEALIARIEPGATATVGLIATFTSPGHHTLTATIPADALAADNQRAVAVLALDQMRALVIEGTPPVSPVERDGFFLANALAPVSALEAAQFYLRPSLATAASLDSVTLAGTDLVVLANLPQLPPATVAALRGYVEAGGALMVFPGPSTHVDFYNNDPDFAALLPGRLGPQAEPVQGAALVSQGYTHPVSALWNDREMGDLGGIRLDRYYPLTPVSSAVERTGALLRFADGSPAALTHTVGRGHVALFATTATTDWSNLPVHSAFIPLLHRLVAHLTQRTGDGLALAPGDVFSHAVSAELGGKDFSVLRPGDTLGRRIAGRIEATGEIARLTFTDTAAPGGYALFTGDETRPLVTFAVQVDPAESDLAPFPGDPLSADASAPAASLAMFNPAAARPRELWPWVIALVFLLALLESALAHRFSQAK